MIRQQSLPCTELSALDLAVLGNDPLVVQALLDVRADPSAPFLLSGRPDSPFMVASRKRHMTILYSSHLNPGCSSNFFDPSSP